MEKAAKLEEIATEIRRSIITMLHTAGTGHSAGSLGMADVLTSLYFSGVLKHRPEKPHWEERDYLLLSNGHICPVLYACLAKAGYFDQRELSTLRQINSRLQGHPHLGSVPGVENTSGPLGQGVSQAAGLAKALKMDGKLNHVYCIASDGEHQEGMTWESYLFAAKERLSNLTILIDRNGIQIGGFTKNIMPLAPLSKKISSFGWDVVEIDGHDFKKISWACQKALDNTRGPTAIICDTIPGKGVSFMENKPEWHGRAPDDEQFEQAIKELA